MSDCVEFDGCCDTHSPCLQYGRGVDGPCTGWPCPEDSAAADSDATPTGSSGPTS